MTFAQLALICGVAIIGPLLSLQRWVNFPVVIGELVVGLALGATGLRLITSKDTTFTFLAEIGFALVMFVAGSHIPVRSQGLRTGLRIGILRAVAIGIASVPAGLGLAALFHTGHGLLYAVLLSSSSAALIMPSLAGAPVTGPPVVAMLAQVAVADAMCIVLLPLAITPDKAAQRGLAAVALILVAGLLFVFLRWSERSGHRRAIHTVSEDRGLALELRTSLTLLFALVALAQFTHLSVMLPGFALGVVFSAVGEPRRLAKQLFALTEGFFGPIFFVWLGTSLDLRDVVSRPALVLLGTCLGLAAAVIHTAAALTHQPWPLATITSAQLGVPIAAAAIGRAQGLLAPGEDAALLLGALVTIAVTAAVSGRVAAVAKATALPEPPKKAKGHKHPKQA